VLNKLNIIEFLQYIKQSVSILPEGIRFLVLKTLQLVYWESNVSSNFVIAVVAGLIRLRRTAGTRL
jgi:hypothetical protein